MALLPEQSLELVELGDATGEHKTVAATRECRGDIAGDLAVARGIHRDLALDLGEAAGCIEVDLGAEGGFMDAQGPRRDASLLVPSSERSSRDRKSTRLNSSHVAISYAVFCLQHK